MGDLDGAVNAYEQALRHNQYSIQAMNAISCILRTKENFPRAVEYLQAILKLDASNGEVWGSLGPSRRPATFLFSELIPSYRSLLLDDGRSSASIFCLPTSSISPERSQGNKSTSCMSRALLIFEGAETLVWYRHIVRSLWLVRTRRRSFFPSYAYATRL